MSSTLSRHTVNFDPRDATLVEPYLRDGTPEREALERLIGEPLPSTSAQLRALTLLGAKAVRDAMLTEAYDRAAEADDHAPDPEEAEVEAARRRRSQKRTRPA